MRHNTPDAVIGIGGAGKEIVYRLLVPEINNIDHPDIEMEDLRTWLVDEVLEPKGDEQNYGNDVQMDCFVIDTDTKELDNDRPRVNRISELLREREVDHPDPVSGPSLDLWNVADGTYTDAGHLLGESYVNDIARETGLRAWWLEEGPDMLEPLADYGGGVIRRRAISKALYYSALTSGERGLNDIAGQFDGDEEIALVVGLGGGTGSGIFQDIARDIRTMAGDVDITLFGVLPKLSEASDKGANTYAALSEVEYQALTAQNDFQNVVLFPYLEDANKEEFDEAIINGILSYYNLEQNMAPLDESDQGQGPPRYAPFTVAVPQILRYEGAGIRKTREQFNDYYNSKKSLLDVEGELYDRVESFLRTHYPGVHDVYETPAGADDGATLGDDEVKRLYERLEELQSFIGLDVLPAIGCQVAEDLSDMLSDARTNALKYDDDIDDESTASADQVRRAVVEHMPAEVEDGASFRPTGGFDRPEDEKLIQLYDEEIDAITRRRDVLRAKNHIETADLDAPDVMENEHISDALGMAVDVGYTGNSTRDVKNNLSSFESEVRDQRERIDDLETVRDELGDERDDAMEAWTDAVRDDLETIRDVYRHRDRVTGLLDQLERDVESAVNAARGAGSPEEVPSIHQEGLEFDEFEELNEKLEAAGIDPIPKSDVEELVSHTWQAQKEWLEDSGGWLFGSDEEDQQAEHARHFRVVNRDIDLDLVSLPSWDERPGRKPQFHSVEFDERRSDIESPSFDDVVDALEDETSSPGTVDDLLPAGVRDGLADPDLVDEFAPLGADGGADAVESGLEALADSDVDEVLAALTAGEDDDGGPGAAFEAFHEAYLGELDRRLGTARDELDGYESARDRYQDVEGIVDQGATYANQADDMVAPSSISEVDETGEEMGTHVKTRTPDDVGTILASNDVSQAGFWSDSTERMYIDDTLKTFTDRAFSPPLLPIDELQIDAPRENPDHVVYDQNRILVSVMSRMFEQNESEEPIGPVVDQLDEDIEMISDRTLYKRTKFGGPWDLSMTVFFGGNMLDNLDIFHSAGDGFKENYEAERSGAEDTIIVRHVHGIDGKDGGRRDGHSLVPEGDDGAYLYRESLLNLSADTDDKLLLLNNVDDEDVVIEELLDRIDVTGFASTFPIDDS